MFDLVDRRCFNHISREAVARCPACHRYFCRECITEHEDRVLCAFCLRQERDRGDSEPSRFRRLGQVGQFTVGMIILWTFFYYLGQVLLLLPSAFHEGKFWQGGG